MSIKIHTISYRETNLWFILMAWCEWGHFSIGFENLSGLNIFEVVLWLFYLLQSAEFYLPLGGLFYHWYLQLSVAGYCQAQQQQDQRPVGYYPHIYCIFKYSPKI